MSYQRCDWLNSRAEKPSNPLGLNIGPGIQGIMAKRETIPPKKPEGELPIEQIEEAEQDATDPTHEKEIPPEKSPRNASIHSGGKTKSVTALLPGGS